MCISPAVSTPTGTGTKHSSHLARRTCVKPLCEECWGAHGCSLVRRVQVRVQVRVRVRVRVRVCMWHVACGVRVRVLDIWYSEA